MQFGVIIVAVSNRFLNGLYQVVRFTGNDHVEFACCSRCHTSRFLHNALLMIC